MVLDYLIYYKMFFIFVQDRPVHQVHQEETQVQDHLQTGPNRGTMVNILQKRDCKPSELILNTIFMLLHIEMVFIIVWKMYEN